MHLAERITRTMLIGAILHALICAVLYVLKSLLPTRPLTIRAGESSQNITRKVTFALFIMCLLAVLGGLFYILQP